MRRILIISFVVLSARALVEAQGTTGSVKLQGTIVCCQDCWMKADRRVVQYGTAADIAQAAECIKKGDPTLLATMDSGGTTTFYQLELGAYKRSGKNWFDYVGKLVEVTGAMRVKKNINSLKVDDLRILSAPNVPPETSPQSIMGTDAELVLKDLFGVDQRLSSYRGRIIVLNFWATYCVPCRKEMPDLAAIQNEFAALGVQVIGAAADDMKSIDKVKRFIKDAKINFPVWMGASAGDMERFGLGSALPGTLVIGREGKVIAVIRGVIRASELRKQLEVLLAKSDEQANRQVASTGTPANKVSSVPS